MIIKSRLKDYEVSFSEAFGFIEDLRKIEHRFVVVDSKVLSIYKEPLQPLLDERTMAFTSLERNKSAKKALDMAEAMMDLPSKRNTVLISIGGGILQDVTGFAASVLYRGIKWVFIPTTLLAQTDSCIGSKTSLNHAGHKNLLGTFYPPDRIYIDAGFVGTLTRRDYLSGVGEMAKIAITSGELGIVGFEQDLPMIIKRNPGIVQKWIKHSLEIKKQYIEKDEFDAGERRLLNYGHTFGHALEATSQYAIPHGQGVSAGMLIANNISMARGYISPELNARLQRMLVPLISVKPTPDFFSEDFINAIKKDKKRKGSSLAAILLRSGQGGAALVEVHDINEAEVRVACRTAVQLLSGDSLASG